MNCPAFLTRLRVPGLHFLVLNPRRDLCAPTKAGCVGCNALKEDGAFDGGMIRRAPGLAGGLRDQRRRHIAQNGMSSSGPPPNSPGMFSSAGTVAPAALGAPGAAESDRS